MKDVLVALAVASLTLSTGSARGQQGTAKSTKDALDGLPAAVREAVKQQTGDATLVGVIKELVNGATFYEVETTLKSGRTRDFMLDSQGQLVSAEEEIPLGEIPEGARAAILKAVGTGKLVKLEKVTQGQKTFYEGRISQGSSLSEVKVDASGRPIG